MANKAFTVKHGLNPSTDNSVDLGTSSLEFKDLYIDGTAFIDAIGFGSTAITLPSGAGNNGQVLKSNGSNALTWADDTAGTITALNNQTEDRLVTIGSTTTQLDGEANLTFDGQTLDLDHDTSNPTLTYSEGGTERGSVAYVPAANELRLIAKEAGSSMSLQTANSEAIYISSSQQIGIGTSSPSYALSVESAAQVNDDSRFSMSLYDTTAMAAGVGAGIAFWGRHTSGSFSYMGAIHGAKSNGTDSNLDGDLVFSTRQHSGGTMSERVRMTPTGVGIGTASVETGAVLHVAHSNTSNANPELLVKSTLAGNVNSHTRAQIESGGGDASLTLYDKSTYWTMAIDQSNSSRLDIGTGQWPTPKLSILTGGKVGINITDPEDYSDASGTVLVVGNTSGATTRSGVSIITDQNGIGRLAFGDGAGDPDQWRGLIQYTHGTSDAMGFATAGNAVGMTFVGDKLGIRTASPSSNLDVVGNTEYTTLFYGTSSGSAYTKVNLTGNDRANLAHQRTDSVGTTATTIFSQSALGTYRDMGLVLVAGRVHGVNKFFYDLVFLVGSEDGKTVAIRSDSYGSGVASRSYTTSSNSLQLAMSSGTYKVRCVGLMSSSEY